jgi:hypothetical protein
MMGSTRLFAFLSAGQNFLKGKRRMKEVNRDGQDRQNKEERITDECCNDE